MKRFAFLFPVAGLAGLPGCAPPIPRPQVSQRAAEAPALPPAPTLEVKPWRKLLDDGSYTVEGLLRDRDSVMGELVSVTGKVSRVVKCAAPPAVPAPPAAPGKPPAEAPPPQPPATCNPPQHLILVDPEAGSTPKWELTVYGTMRSALAEVSEGEVTTLTGDFAMMSPDGVFLRQGGMLLLPDDAPPPGP